MNTITVKQAAQLKELAHKTPTSEVILTTLALRDRMRLESDLNRFKTQLVKENGNVVDSDYLDTFRDLERLGMGSIVYGRKKKPTKFIWKYNLKEVGQSAIDNSDTKKPVEEVSVVPQGLTADIRIGNAEVKMNFKTKEQALDFLKSFSA